MLESQDAYDGGFGSPLFLSDKLPMVAKALVSLHLSENESIDLIMRTFHLWPTLSLIRTL